MDAEVAPGIALVKQESGASASKKLKKSDSVVSVDSNGFPSMLRSPQDSKKQGSQLHRGKRFTEEDYSAMFPEGLDHSSTCIKSLMAMQTFSEDDAVAFAKQASSPAASVQVVVPKAKAKAKAKAQAAVAKVEAGKAKAEAEEESEAGKAKAEEEVEVASAPGWTVMSYRKTGAVALRKTGGGQYFQIIHRSLSETSLRNIVAKASFKADQGMSQADVKEWAKVQADKLVKP